MFALALEGGGARGAFSIGAVKALMESGYQFGAVAGTSIGALNGAMIAQGDWQLCYDWWQRLDTRVLFDIDSARLRDVMNRRIDKPTLTFMADTVKNIIDNGGMDVTGVRETLEKIINEQKLRASPMEFGLVTVSMRDFKPVELFKEDIPEGKMIDYLMASANVPVFKLTPIDGEYYIDGGFYDNCPINLLCSRGYRDFVVVRTLAIGVKQRVRYKGVNITQIAPSEELGNILYFDGEVIEHDLKLGYCDAMRVIKGLKGQRYYLTAPQTPKWGLKLFLRVPEKVLAPIADSMMFSGSEPRRLLFEKMIPAFAGALGLGADAGYDEIALSLLEKCAESRGIERLQLMEFEQFTELLKNTPPPEQSRPDNVIKAIADSVKNRSVRVGEYELLRMGEELIKRL